MLRDRLHRANAVCQPLLVCRLWILALVFVCLLPQARADESQVGPAPGLQISGSVKQPLFFDLDDLAGFTPLHVRINELGSKGSYHGAFVYEGVPLKTLLRLARPEKEGATFAKLIDLAILVRNRAGRQVALSFGEVFYRNPGDAVLAYRATPVHPLKDCRKCHHDDKYRRWLDPLDRKVGFPKLALPRDRFGDRDLEDVTDIEVVELGPEIARSRKKPLFSPAITLKGSGKHTTIKSLAKLPRREMVAIQTGDGRGYHGNYLFEGASLAGLLKARKIELPLDSWLRVSAPDGYRTILSAGEIEMAGDGDDILIADRKKGRPLKNGGRFQIVLPHDLSADRWVKAVSLMEVMRVNKQPKIYVIGMGCGDTRLITLDALSKLARADVMVGPKDIQQRFAAYLGGKPFLFDPLQASAGFCMQKNPGMTKADCLKKVAPLQADYRRQIAAKLKEGKNVGLLDYGDPALYGGWSYWLPEGFPKDQIEIVPGISSFNAANALLGKNVARSGSVMISVPYGLKKNEPLLAAAAKNGDTLAILIGLKNTKKLAKLLSKYYPPEAPVLVVYKAGYIHEQHLRRTTLSKLADTVAADPEKFLGIIYLGDALKPE